MWEGFNFGAQAAAAMPMAAAHAVMGHQGSERREYGVILEQRAKPSRLRDLCRARGFHSIRTLTHASHFQRLCIHILRYSIHVFLQDAKTKHKIGGLRVDGDGSRGRCR